MFLENTAAGAIERSIAGPAMMVFTISTLSMLTCQLLKFLIGLMREREAKWYMLISTGGFPSSHTGFTVALCVSLGIFQCYTQGQVDWSFAVALVYMCVIIHDAMGVRLEASKHAVILNNMAENYTEEEKQKLGYGKKGHLKEMLGHHGTEVLGGVLVGVIFGIAGFFICMPFLTPFGA
ncbi:MAG: divergent PAP2 family protein [Acholeplasmatales bacterium]|nr:divergent PAP2 family protein [Acholeplasmatales bacterium]